MAPPTSDSDLSGPRALLRELVRSRVFSGASPRLLERYQVRRVLGRGGSGLVVAAFDRQLEREVAVKALEKHDEQRTLQEARLMARVRHPNVVPVYDVGSDNNCVYVVMELIRGQSIAEWLEPKRSIDEILTLFEKAGEGLQAAHDQGIVHRDFKPQNVLVGADGAPRVVDFGLAAAVSASTGRFGERRANIGGTPGYMAPEQWHGEEIDERADQFAFCVCIVEAVFGRRIMEARSGGELLRAISELRLLDERYWPIGTEMRQLLLQGLALDKLQRLPSIRALLKGLRRARQKEQRPPERPAAEPTESRRAEQHAPDRTPPEPIRIAPEPVEAFESDRIRMTTQPPVFIWKPTHDMTLDNIEEDVEVFVQSLGRIGGLQLEFHCADIPHLTAEHRDIWRRALLAVTGKVQGLRVVQSSPATRLGLNSLALSLKLAVEFREA